MFGEAEEYDDAGLNHCEGPDNEVPADGGKGCVEVLSVSGKNLVWSGSGRIYVCSLSFDFFFFAGVYWWAAGVW